MKLQEWHDLFVALAGALVGGLLTYLGAFLLARQSLGEVNDAVRQQLMMLLRVLESKLIIRRDHDATSIGGYDADLKRLIDRATSTEAAVALLKRDIRQFYQAIADVEAAIVSIQYSAEMIRTKNDSSYLEPMRRAATLACEDCA